MLNRFFRGKRAQITIFMIIGIVLVIGAIIYFTLFYGRAEIIPEEERGVEVPLEVKPIKDFVESCTQDIGIEALKLAGQHGGYIYPLEVQDDGRVFNIDPLDPSSSDGVAITEDAESGVVYWWYLKSHNNCYNCKITTENIPKIDSIERQTNKYIAENLDKCLDDFRSFEKGGFDITELGPPVATTRVTEKDVVVSLKFPLRAVLAGKSTDMDRFISHIPINLKKVYSLASEIALVEANHNFLEYLTQSWISINGGLRAKMLPPMYAIEDSYVPRIWIEEVVNLQLRDLFTSYVSLLQVNETKNAVPVEIGGSGLEKGIYSSFFLNILNRTEAGEGYEEYSARFYYLNWPLYLHISPNDNGVLRAVRVTHFPMMLPGLPSFVPIAPQREYEFFYDLSYPVVVELRNDEDLFGEGYTWLFGLEVNLRDNRGVEEWFEGKGTYGSWDYSWVRFDPPTEELKMVEGGEDLLLVSQNYTKNLFCSPKQRISGNISVKVKDALDDSLLEGVSVQYSCGRYASCMMGRTEFDLDHNTTWLYAKFPVCIGGGIMVLEKEGYKTERIIDLSTGPGEAAEFGFEMVQISLKNVTIKKLLLERVEIYREPLEDHGNNYTRFLQLSGSTADPDFSEETIIINVRKVDEPIPPIFPAQNLIIDNSTGSSNTIKLVPGTYEIQTTYIDTSGYIVEPEKRCKDGDENCFFVPEEPGLALDQAIGGGLTLDEETGFWEIGWDDIASGDEIVFKVLQLPAPLVIEDLNEMSMIQNLSWQFRTQLQPEFI